MAKRALKWTPELIARLDAMAAARKTKQEAADALGVHVNTIDTVSSNYDIRWGRDRTDAMDAFLRRPAA